MNNEWMRLEADMLRTGMFHGPRLTSRFLAKNFYSDRAVVRVRADNPLRLGKMDYCAYITWLPTADPIYCEIALAYVAEDLEGKGLLKEITGKVLQLLPRIPVKGKPPEEWPRVSSFLITNNPAMMHVAATFGFRMVTKFTMPNVKEWAKRVGLGKRLPKSATARDPHHSGRRKRWLLMR